MIGGEEDQNINNNNNSNNNPIVPHIPRALHEDPYSFKRVQEDDERRMSNRFKNNDYDNYFNWDNNRRGFGNGDNSGLGEGGSINWPSIRSVISESILRSASVSDSNNIIKGIGKSIMWYFAIMMVLVIAILIFVMILTFRKRYYY